MSAYQPFWISVFILSILSLISSFVVIITYIILLKKYNAQRKKIKDYVWILSFPQAYLMFNIIIESSNPAFGMNWYSNMVNESMMCWLLAFLRQFGLTFGLAAEICIAMGILLPTINNIGGHELDKRVKFHKVFTITSALVLSLLPLNAYGLTDAGSDEYGIEYYMCWISRDKKEYLLVYYIPLGLYMICCFCVFIYYVYLKYCKKQIMEQQENINQMIIYTGIYVIQWIPAILTRIYNVHSNGSMHVIMVSIFWIFVSSIGVSNMLVWIWYFSDSTIGCSKSIQLESDSSQYGSTFDKVLM